MNPTTINNQTIALAGVLQSAHLVDKIACTGSAPAESFNPLINSLFQFDAKSPAAVYGGLPNLKLGLQLINDLLAGNNSNEYRTTVRYALGILHLQNKLASNPELLQIIRNRLEHTAFKAEHFSDNVHGITSSLASIYQDTVSTFKFRIQVNGSLQQLQNPVNADHIRALLLAGIRSAVLWRQSGGKRWHLLFKRQQLLKASRELLKA